MDHLRRPGSRLKGAPITQDANAAQRSDHDVDVAVVVNVVEQLARGRTVVVERVVERGTEGAVAVSEHDADLLEPPLRYDDVVCTVIVQVAGCGPSWKAYERGLRWPRVPQRAFTSGSDARARNAGCTVAAAQRAMAVVGAHDRRRTRCAAFAAEASFSNRASGSAFT